MISSQIVVPADQADSNFVSAMMTPRPSTTTGCPLVGRDTQLAHPPGETGADQPRGHGEGDVLVMACGGLRRRREHRRRQAARLQEARGQRFAVHRAVTLVLPPGRAGEVAAHDALDRQHLGPPDEHSPAGEPGRHAPRRGSRRGRRSRGASGRAGPAQRPNMPSSPSAPVPCPARACRIRSRRPRSGRRRPSGAGRRRRRRRRAPCREQRARGSPPTSPRRR